VYLSLNANTLLVESPIFDFQHHFGRRIQPTITATTEKKIRHRCTRKPIEILAPITALKIEKK
jgi:hypothetical protein